MSQKMDPAALAAELDKYEPGYLPEPLFLAIARLSVLVAVEFIPLRQRVDGGVEVLLIKRPATDPFWPNMLHTPGTMLRADDTDLRSAFDRLFKDELRCGYIEPQFVAPDILHSKRGVAATIQYIIPFTDKPSNGMFYDANNLPDSLVEEQRPMIKAAVKKFTTP